MPAKMTRSVPSAAVRAARRAGSHPHLAWVLREGQKSARIHAPSGVIWGIPIYTYTGALYTSFDTGCLNNPKTGPCVPNPNAAIDALIFGTRLTGSVTFRFDTTGVSGKFDNFGNDIGLTQFVSGGFFWSGPIVHVTLANRKPLRDSQTPAIHPPR